MNYVLIVKSLRESSIIRALLMPVALLKRKADRRRYVKSDDAKHIRALRNINKGKRCFIIGNGPSLTVDDLNMLKGEITFASNRIFDIFPYTDWRPTYYMNVDKDIAIDMLINKPDFSDLSQTEMFCSNRTLVQRLKKNLKAYEIFPSGKFSVDPGKRIMTSVSEDFSDHYSISLSVTCPMIELAMYMGITTIYLLGLDHSFGIEIDINGKKRRNPDAQPHFKEQKDKKVYPAYKEGITKSYEVIRAYADQHGINIKNATRGGKLEVFERVDFDTLFH